jgi:hypothetical protein
MHAVRNETQSLYRVLDVPKDASPQEIERAYRRIKARMQQETTPPDPRLRILIEHAHDVLTDAARRGAYDRQWDSPAAQAKRVARSPAALAAIVAAVASVSAAAWLALRDEAPSGEARPRKDVQGTVSMAVGRVSRIDLNGHDALLGVAFAIADGTLVTSCEGLKPDAQVLVHFGKRAAPVSVSATDEATGLCTLSGSNVGSWPLTLASAPPHPGQPVYGIAVARDFEPKLVDGKVRTVPGGILRAIEAEPAPPAEALGAPLLDRNNGHVIGAAARVEGKVGYVAIPRALVPKPTVSPAAARPAEPQPQTHPAETDAAQPVPPPAANISPERRERLEKAFRPPPTVPADL